MPFFDVKIRENLVIGHIDESEIFRLTFNPQNFAENFHKSVPIPPNEADPAKTRKWLQELFPEKTEEELESSVEPAGAELNKIVHEEKAKDIAARISENLHGLLIAVMEDAIRAYAVRGTIDLNKRFGVNVAVGEYKKVILKQHWSRIRDLAEIKKGGARKRKGFVWTQEKKIYFFKQVEELPKHKGESVWEYILKTLIDQEFDAETIGWLKTRPALKGIPENLFQDAVKAWRKYLTHEKWNEIKQKDKARAFEFRHALHLLQYPDKYTYSTLETYYYEGKKLSEMQK